jgi:hypothetical protein
MLMMHLLPEHRKRVRTETSAAPLCPVLTLLLAKTGATWSRQVAAAGQGRPTW